MLHVGLGASRGVKGQGRIQDLAKRVDLSRGWVRFQFSLCAPAWIPMWFPPLDSSLGLFG